MPALPVHRKWRRNPTPRRWLALSCNYLSTDSKVGDLIEFNCLKTRIGNRQRIPRYRIANPELVLGVSTFPYADEKFPNLTSDSAAYP